MAEIILLRLAEREDTVLPSDARGNLEDFATIAGATTPAVITGLTGPARDFATVADTAMEADDIDDAALLQRDVSIQVIIDLDLDAQDTAGTDGVIFGARSAWHLRWRVVDLATGRVAFRLGWLTGGAEATVDEGTFYPPSQGYVVLTATRRWLSATEVRVRYYVNDQLLGEYTSADGDIDGDAAELVVMGARDDGAAGYELFSKAAIDQVRVTDTELTAEEVRQVFRRMTAHAAMGRRAIRASLPVGPVYSTEADSIVQRELAAEGDALGLAFGILEELREDFFPERAWSMLEDWERITKLSPKLLDTTEVRRARIASFFQKVQGYSLPAIADALADVLDLAAADVQVLEYTNLHEDSFDTAVADWWQQRADVGTISVAAGAVTLELNNGADGQLGVGQPVMIYQSIDGDVLDGDNHSLDADITVKVTSVTLPDGSAGGLCTFTGGGDLLWLGFYEEAGTLKLGWRTYVGGVLGAVNVLENPAPARPQWLRLRYDGGTGWTLWYNGTGPNDLSNETAITGITAPLWAGLVVFADVAASAGVSDVTFDDWRGWFPNGLRVFNWQAYRDPGLAGSADLAGARRIVEKLKPAETEATATTFLSLECDDSAALCDDTPLG